MKLQTLFHTCELLIFHPCDKTKNGVFMAEVVHVWNYTHFKGVYCRGVLCTDTPVGKMTISIG